MPPAPADVAPAELARSLEAFLAEHPRAALLEDGRALFEMSSAHYALSTEYGRCVLHLWSEERNIIRTVVGLEERQSSLRLFVRRLGHPRPQTLHLVRDRDQRTPSARAVTRSRYLRTLERLLVRHFTGYSVEMLRSAMDLEHSFGPGYARGILTRGQAAWAVIGVNQQEAHATIDGILTLGILWLAHCREHAGGRRFFEGLKLFLPAGAGETTRSRMPWLNPELGRYELYEMDEATEELAPLDIAGEGNLKMRLVHAFNPQAALERAAAGVDRLLTLLPEGMRARVEVRPRSVTEVALSLYGLEFARVRHGYAPNSFARQNTLTFGAGANETPLTPETEPLFTDLAERLFQNRHPAAAASNPLYRMQPEGWLESVLRRDLGELEPRLQSMPVYAQVPAFSAADRGMLDLLTATRSGRLAVLELKAGEDLHLPFQGLDYWIRVHALQQQRDPAPGPTHAQGELQRSGYFPGLTLRPEPPLLYYVVPALHVHPTLETVLRHFAPSIEWTLLAINEDWRTERQVVFRKHGGSAAPRG